MFPAPLSVLAQCHNLSALVLIWSDSEIFLRQVDGQNEITCSQRADDRTLWSVDEGIFHPRQAQ